MKCPNCGKDVKEGAKFCVGCGTSLINTEENKLENVEEKNTNQNVEKTDASQSVESINNEQKLEEVKQKVNTTVDDVKKKAKQAANSDFMQIILASLMFLFNLLLKPIKTLKAKIDYYANPKNGFILAGVVALATMIIRVVMSFIMAIIRKECSTSIFGEKNCKSIGDKIGNIDWMGITLKHLAIILIIMFAIAGIYYIASLVFKKSVNFMRLLTITVVSLVPACLAAYLLVPIFGWINIHFGVIVSIAGFVYSMVIFFTAIKDELNFENADKGVYFHLICVSVIIIITYFIGYNLTANSLNNLIF